MKKLIFVIIFMASGSIAEAYDPQSFETVRIGGDCLGCDLSGADLTKLEGSNNINLSGANLSGALLSNSSISRFITSGTNFSGAIIVDDNTRCGDGSYDGCLR